MPTAKKGEWPRSYTDAERARLVGEIERRFRAGEGSLKSIARQLGTCEASYYNWSKTGIRPAAPHDLGDGRRTSALVPARGTPVPAKSAGGGAAPAAVTVERQRAADVEDVSFRPVTVSVAPVQISSAAAKGLVLAAPGGYRIEGLGIEDAAALLKALA